MFQLWMANTGDVLSTTVSGLSSGIGYQFKIAALSTAGTSALSAASKAITTLCKFQFAHSQKKGN